MATVTAFLEQLVQNRLRSYAAEPGLLREHYGIEQSVLAGGYGYRQVLELVQNGADAILEAYENGSPLSEGNRVRVLLRNQTLYVANTGAPLSHDGLDALLRSHSSPKRGIQIGRFGLGFKSLLRLEGQIDIFMRSGDAIRFDPARCRSELIQRFGVEEAPGLRLAWALPSQAKAEDEVVSSELDWAETIIRAPVKDPLIVQHLRKEIAEFPAEFLLFFPVATDLELDIDGAIRVLRVSKDGPEQVLWDGAEATRWRVLRDEVHITDPAARMDATHIHMRERVPVAWAVPVSVRREESGRFWAFFPTRTPTYLPGILNAPWKLNSDRNAIIGGEWNSALMREAATLVAAVLPSFRSSEDPAQHLDAFPRQLERRDEDAAPLVEAVWRAISQAPIIPDGNGTLRRAMELWRPPRDSLPLAERWSELAPVGQRADYCHFKCLERPRASRLAVLADRLQSGADWNTGTGPKLQQRDASDWFRSVRSEGGEAARGVLLLAEDYARDCRPQEWEAVRPNLDIIPVEGGGTVRPAIALLCPPGAAVPGRKVVSQDIAQDTKLHDILKNVMLVGGPSDDLWRQTLFESLNQTRWGGPTADRAWRTFWERLRHVPKSVARDFLITNPICVLRSDGAWVLPTSVLLPGAIIRVDEEDSNRRLLLDSEFHAADGVLLEILKISDQPSGEIEGQQIKTVLPTEWLNWCRDEYKKRQQNAALREYLQPLQPKLPAGMQLLQHLQGRANVRLTDLLLRRLSDPALTMVTFGHRTAGKKYPTMELPHPVLHILATYGHVEFGGRIVSLAALLSRRGVSVLAKLECWRAAGPFLLHVTGAVPETRIPEPGELHALWAAAIAELWNELEQSADGTTELWVAAAADGFVPGQFVVHGRVFSISEVFVTSSRDLARHARADDHLTIVVPEGVLKLWLIAGAQDLSATIRPHWTMTSGPDVPVATVFPELAAFLTVEAGQVARCRTVSELLLEVRGTHVPIPCIYWDGEFLFDGEQLRVLSHGARLAAVINEIYQAGWLSITADEAVRRANLERVQQTRNRVAECSSLAEKLVALVGDRRERLLEALGEHASLPAFSQATNLELAEATIAFHGPSVLSALSAALDAEGLDPPRRWSSAEARAFVESIGFPPEFAASPNARRDPEEIVVGPFDLAPLHDFQQEVFEGLQELCGSKSMRRRAVVSLPTGGGKTRVTVEAAVRLVLAPPGHARCVIWIAQTDELCEQAFQAFRQVWRNAGAENTPLRLIRLWGGNPTPFLQELDRPVAVVSSIQTLNTRLATDRLDWLKACALVVMDECHHAITASYTNVLRWLEVMQRSDQIIQQEPVVIGLSATPFRTDDDESARLARRFESRWLPQDQEDLHARLQMQGVLARIVYEPLKSGASLSQEELEKLSRIREPWEGLEFENILEQINQRLGLDKSRNETLLNFVKDCHATAILFFANSVHHAEEMAIRLSLLGIRAAAVSGRTPAAARRYFLERFQSGEIRVLCNQSVLATGFDAPRTDMVLIARQVFSPVRFMQMVGRGLRGEKNGGTAECRLVTVLDNLGRFQDKHPYDFCKRYFEATP
ncbi:hypothetical protein GCM10027034_20030 [Ramlibacter solisilvae]